MGKRLSFQQTSKHAAKVCLFCQEDSYDLLEVHRIVPGECGGKYQEHNIVITCRNCHRRIHVGELIIDRYYRTTKGRLLHYFEEDKEFWK